MQKCWQTYFWYLFWRPNVCRCFWWEGEKAIFGEVIGAREFDFETHTADAHVWNKDQVTIIPPSAQVTARATYCPVGALKYDFPAAGVQFHPEYSEH